MKWLHVVTGLVMLVVAAAALGARAGTSSDSAQSAGKFVQEFYDWYVPIAADGKREGTSFVVALKERRHNFSGELYRSLMADFRAQAASTEEIVGIDWDPFLNSQDPGDYPGDPYRVGEVSQVGENYRVALYRVVDGVKDQMPAATAELGRKSRRWVFTNFLSPDRRDLLGALKLLRSERAK